jgi:hypothetical protein
VPYELQTPSVISSSKEDPYNQNGSKLKCQMNCKCLHMVSSSHNYAHNDIGS